MLSTNINDLKVQLNQNGINNATFNFNSSSQNGENQNQNQNNKQQNAKKEYGYFDEDEQNEEILKSLEIIVPYYA
jgi:flagellar hook-length control protein FliK